MNNLPTTDLFRSGILLKNYILTMQYYTKSENRYPSNSSLKLIDDVIEAIKFNNPSDLKSFLNYAQGQRVRLAFDADYTLQYIPTEHKIMEVGSSPPILTGVVQKLGYSIVGVDISPELFQDAISHLNLIVKKCNIETESLPFPDNSFDVILLNEVFEHLRINLIFTMQEMLRVLKPEGKIFISTPNLKSLRGISNFIIRDKAYACGSSIYKEYRKLQRYGHMGHIREYTKSEISDFLEEIGFDVQGFIYRGGMLADNKIKQVSKQIFYGMFPQLRPFFSVIALKR